MPKALADAAMLISGAAMGAAVTPDAIAAMGRYPGSLILLVIGVVAISAASTCWLVRISGWRKADAVLASVPGALSTVHRRRGRPQGGGRLHRHRAESPPLRADRASAELRRRDRGAGQHRAR